MTGHQHDSESTPYTPNLPSFPWKRWIPLIVGMVLVFLTIRFMASLRKKATENAATATEQISGDSTLHAK